MPEAGPASRATGSCVVGSEAMAGRPGPRFEERTIDDLRVVDERSFRSVPLYADLKEILRRDKYAFRVFPRRYAARWDWALFLNLTYWGAAGGDVLEGTRVAADVVAHAAWHHLAARALPKTSKRSSARALFLGESIASAFDVYLIGRLLGCAGGSSFLETQVPAMAQSSKAAGLGGRAFERLLEQIAADPEGSFGDLRHLLYEATCALFACRGGNEALGVLARFDTHRFAPLLHHYELSNWVLYARAYAAPGLEDAHAQAVAISLQRQESPLTWLASRWIAPRLAGQRRKRLPRTIKRSPGD